MWLPNYSINALEETSFLASPISPDLLCSINGRASPWTSCQNKQVNDELGRSARRDSAKCKEEGHFPGFETGGMN